MLPPVETTSRIGNSGERQPIAADRAGDGDVGDLPRRVAGVGIVGAASVDVAVKYSRYPSGIVVTHLCAQRCEREKEQKGQETRIILFGSFHIICSWVDHGARVGGLADGL